MDRAHRVCVSLKTLFDAFNWVEPVLEMGILLLSPIETFSLPWYGCRFCGPIVMWWVAPESTVEGLVVALNPTT